MFLLLAAFFLGRKQKIAAFHNLWVITKVLLLAIEAAVGATLLLLLLFGFFALSPLLYTNSGVLLLLLLVGFADTLTHTHPSESFQ